MCVGFEIERWSKRDGEKNVYVNDVRAEFSQINNNKEFERVSSSYEFILTKQLNTRIFEYFWGGGNRRYLRNRRIEMNKWPGYCFWKGSLFGLIRACKIENN